VIWGGESIGDGGDGSDDVYNRSMKSVLVSASNSYFEDEEILVDDSRHSSCPAYTIY